MPASRLAVACWLPQLPPQMVPALGSALGSALVAVAAGRTTVRKLKAHSERNSPIV
jgi:hypothetical protein